MLPFYLFLYKKYGIILKKHIFLEENAVGSDRVKLKPQAPLMGKNQG